MSGEEVAEDSVGLLSSEEVTEDSAGFLSFDVVPEVLSPFLGFDAEELSVTLSLEVWVVDPSFLSSEVVVVISSEDVVVEASSSDVVVCSSEVREVPSSDVSREVLITVSDEAGESAVCEAALPQAVTSTVRDIRRAVVRRSLLNMVRDSLSEMLFEKRLKLIERNIVLVTAVVEVSMHCAGDDQELFVVSVFAAGDHVLVCVLGEVAGVCFLAVDQKDCGPDLVAVL